MGGREEEAAQRENRAVLIDGERVLLSESNAQPAELYDCFQMGIYCFYLIQYIDGHATCSRPKSCLNETAVGKAETNVTGI